jgi:hypothetical protein
MQICFDAVGALSAWHSRPLPPIEVKKAREWKASHADDILKSQAQIMEYDWYSSVLNSVCTSMLWRWFCMQCLQKYPDSPGMLWNLEPGCVRDAVHRNQYGCRTFTTDYVGEVQHSSGERPDAVFIASDDKLDRALLLERAQILFAAEVPLYESEMDDNGVSSCVVRVCISLQLWQELCHALQIVLLRPACGPKQLYILRVMSISSHQLPP